jgi:3,4-dihydroxy 2-butanone 4-phosphate synthase/GTP cyclohydrolase II
MTKKVSVERVVCARVPTQYGEFQLCLYSNDQDDKEHLAFVMGEVQEASIVMVRVHSECFTGDVFGSQRCDCGEQLDKSLSMIAKEGMGVLVYMRQEGRGIGLLEKLRAYNLQDDGFDTVDANLALGHQADSRDYTVTAAILDDLGIESVRLITNNPEKIEKLKKLGVNVVERVEIPPTLNPNNERYLRTKVNRMNHLLDLPSLGRDELDNGSD